ncbi:MAG: glutathione S-transferase N-terminal domain-containing protein [Alphaproteobacteria bacterium]|nr:glutathione S-transferase N-terminal domain-containing protein [Alphaproteobacteria bacterium]
MIDLYTAGTMNGRRAALALSECGLAHRIHVLDLQKGEQHGADFLALNPSGVIPVLVDDDAPAAGLSRSLSRARSSSTARRSRAV